MTLYTRVYITATHENVGILISDVFKDLKHLNPCVHFCISVSYAAVFSFTSTTCEVPDPLFPGIKTFLFKGDGAEIFLNVTLSQMPFKFHPSFHLCCFSLSFLLKKKPHSFFPPHAHSTPSLCHFPHLPCGFPCLLLLLLA